MQPYKHILFATDCSPLAPLAGAHVLDMARRYDARVTLVHVVEEVNISAGYELMPLLPELPDETITREAQGALARLGDQLGVPESDRVVVTAISTKEGVIETARTRGVDLIVVGSHGRHGLALLLGSTANAVLHGAPCDVLALRIPEAARSTLTQASPG